jgi:hypothetical protein
MFAGHPDDRQPRQLRRRGSEIAWWESVGLKPLDVAQRLWRETRFGAEGYSSLPAPSP